MDQIHRTIQKAREKFPPDGYAHNKFLADLHNRGTIDVCMVFFMKRLIENPDLDYEVDEKGALKISV
tara:strand:- start:72 stop:272 length:201 start_codon:yes stop_codon:yes gene_type:complete